MSGDAVEFLGDDMASVVQAIEAVEYLIGQPPVVVGGLAVLCRLGTQHRATTDLDIVDRLRGARSHLELLRGSSGAISVEPAAVMLPTSFGAVRVDVLEVRQIEIDAPSDDPGDRLHAAAHAWAHETATPVSLRVLRRESADVQVTARVAEPGPLIAMKLQAVMNRASSKQGTDLLDIVRLTLDPLARDRLLQQLAACDKRMSGDIALHVDHWLAARRSDAMHWIQAAGGRDVTIDDLDLTAELLNGALRRR